MIEETNRIISFIAKQGLYRKGLYLYDVEKYRPLYSITELSWNMCRNPFISYKVSEQLSIELPDHFKYKGVDDTQFVNIFNAIRDRAHYQACHKRGFELRLVCDLITSKRGRNVLGVGVVVCILSWLTYLKKKNWEPAEYYLAKYKRYHGE